MGAVLGVTVLSNVNGATLRPYLAMLLTIIGLRILVKFAQPLPPRQRATLPATDGSSKRVLQYDRRGVKTAALIGGVTNGLIGAWGPVVTPFLLHRGVRPRFAVGSVNTAEVAVASASAFSLIASVGAGGFNGAVVLSMLLGGVVAAPVAAWMIRHVPPRPMGVAVAGLLLLTNARDLIAWARITGLWIWAVYIGIIGLVLFAFLLGRGRTPTDVPPPPQRRSAVCGRGGQRGAPTRSRLALLPANSFSFQLWNEVRAAGRRRQRDREDGATIDVVGGGHATIVADDDLLHDGETQTRCHQDVS